MYGFGWSIEFGGGFVCWFVLVFCCFVVNKVEDVMDDVGNY